MSQEESNTFRQKGQHLDWSSRKIIESLLRKGLSRKEIGEAVDIAQSTLTDEIRRGEVKVIRVVKEPPLKRNYYHGKTTVTETLEYNAKFAQEDADKKKIKSVKHFRVFAEKGYIEFIENLVLDNPKKYSPDTANSTARKVGFKGVSTKTLYNWIEWGLLKIKPLDLLLKTKRKPRSKIRKQKREYGKSIDERPQAAEKREEAGHWEGDSIVGAEHKGQLITLVERKHRIVIMALFRQMRAENMVILLRRLKKQYGERFREIFKSITFDNGSEFAYNKKMSKYTDIYYAHAYSSWERGSNENLNGIIRRFIPKGTDITKLTQEQIEHIGNVINTMPRKILGYKTAQESFSSELAAV
jgi:IS30 family transposase